MRAKPTIRSGHAEVNGYPMYYEISGAGEPLVLIHGALMTVALMNDYPAKLAARHQVIAVELQGHGHSGDADRPLRYETLADDVAALLDHLEIQTADVFGYSLGAAVAMQLAMRHPTRTRRVVAASVTYRSDGLHRELRANLAAPDPAQLDGTIYQDSYRAVALDPDHWTRLVQKVFELDNHPQEWPTDDVAGIASPVMLVVADNDIVRLEHTVEMYHLLGGGIAGDIYGSPKSQLIVVPGTTHVGLMDRAEWLVPMINAFL